MRHILYLEGAGRETPYLSTSEEADAAQYFAGTDGIVWQTTVARARARRITHIPRKELMTLLKGTGKGLAAWSSAMLVAQARRYVEEWSEHLLDFSHVEADADLNEVVAAVFSSQAGRRP